MISLVSLKLHLGFFPLVPEPLVYLLKTFIDPANLVEKKHLQISTFVLFFAKDFNRTVQEGRYSLPDSRWASSLQVLCIYSGDIHI